MVSWHYFPKYSIIFPFGKKKMQGKSKNAHMNKKHSANEVEGDVEKSHKEIVKKA